MNECIFCKISNGNTPSFKVYEDDDIVVIMDIDPSSNGHMLAIPKKHYVDFTELDNDIIIKLNIVAKKMKNLIYEKLNADGIRLVNNYGIYQVVKHYHLHIIPTYKEKQKLLNVEEVYKKIIG